MIRTEFTTKTTPGKRPEKKKKKKKKRSRPGPISRLALISIPSRLAPGRRRREIEIRTSLALSPDLHLFFPSPEGKEKGDRGQDQIRTSLDLGL